MKPLFFYDKLTTGNQGGLNLMGLLFRRSPILAPFMQPFPLCIMTADPACCFKHTKAHKQRQCGLDGRQRGVSKW